MIPATTTPSNPKPVLVVGGSGKTGRRVADRLRALGLPVRIGSRSGAPAFDWNDPAGWPAALAGTGAAYIAYSPDLAVPGAPEAIAAFAEVALAAGARRLVLLSGRGEEEAERAERALQASGADWTIVRCSWFNQNFSEDYLRDSVLAGEVTLPVSDVPEPFVDAEDIADVAVAALTDDRHIGQLYELTGPRLLTFADAVGEIGAASGRDVRLARVSGEEFAAGLAGLSTADVTLRGVLVSQGAYVAMLHGTDEKNYIVRTGDKLADGTIRTITSEMMLIQQQVNDPLSKQKEREVRKMLRHSDGTN